MNRGEQRKVRTKERAAMAVVTMRELLDSGVHFGH
ncbi:MAG: 30S ribosomal protein S2, partial [Actinobacteria bacterium]|nr:30S ribosomal protein S2 [Actinomycetota bacterium]